MSIVAWIIHPPRGGWRVTAFLVGWVPRPAKAATNKETARPWFLHLNGIGGERVCDHTLISGLTAGGFEADFHIFDWTEGDTGRSEEHTSELQSQSNLVCRLLLEKKKKTP